MSPLALAPLNSLAKRIGENAETARGRGRERLQESGQSEGTTQRTRRSSVCLVGIFVVLALPLLMAINTGAIISPATAAVLGGGSGQLRVVKKGSRECIMSPWWMSFTIVSSGSGRNFKDPSNVLVPSMRILNFTAKLLFYHENSYSRRQGQEVVDTSLTQAIEKDSCLTVKMYDLMTEFPWLEEFAHGKDNVFDKIREKSRLSYWLQWNVKAHFIFRKVVAVYHAMKVAGTRFVLWMDTDIQFMKDLDANFFNFIGRFDTSYIWRTSTKARGNKRKGFQQAETGIVAYQVTPASRRFVERMMAYYQKPPPDEECLDDTCVFSAVVQEMSRLGEMREGHFATCAHRIGRASPIGKERMSDPKLEGTWEYLVAKYYTAGYRTYACEPKRDNVSTFNLFEYVVHLKGGNKEYFKAVKKNLATVREATGYFKTADPVEE